MSELKEQKKDTLLNLEIKGVKAILTRKTHNLYEKITYADKYECNKRKAY